MKKDAETGKVIPAAGVGFQIFRPDGTKVEMSFAYPKPTTIDTFYTNDEGYLVTPEKLEYGKGYGMKEVQAPYGYLKQRHRVLYFNLLTTSKLHSHLADIEEQAQALFSRLVNEYAAKESVDEQLKRTDQMEWVQRMNNIQARARETVNSDVIFA